MWQGVEAAITLLFEFGEAATEEMVKTNCGVLGPLALGKENVVIMEALIIHQHQIHAPYH